MLPVILSAAVAWSSAPLELDEAGTFDHLRSRRIELFEPEIEKHYGRIFKLMGDGLLAEFGSWSVLSSAPSPCSAEWQSVMAPSRKRKGSISASGSTSAR